MPKLHLWLRVVDPMSYELGRSVSVGGRGGDCKSQIGL